MRQVTAFLLIAVAVLVVAVLIALVLAAAAWSLRRLRPAPDVEPEARRCYRCGRRWRSTPQQELSVMGLRVRRWVRRRARRAERPRPAWSGPAGWSRCPSCFSTQIGTPGDGPADQGWTKVEKGGAVMAVMGLVLVVVAVAALAAA